MSDPEKLRQLIRKIHILPAMPEVAQEVVRMQYNYDQGVEKLVNLIEKDPVILARVIGSANSSLFGPSRQIVSVLEAVIVLGIDHIKMLAMNFAMMSYKMRTTPGRFNMHALWQHSVAVTMALHLMSSYMPEEVRPKGDEILLAGLLHDVGFMVLDYVEPELSDEFHARLAADPQLAVEQAEDELLDLNHCELGAELGKHWDLPDTIIDVLRYHNQPDCEEARSGSALIRMVNMAERLLPSLGNPEFVDAGVTPGRWLALGISPEDGEAIVAKVQGYAEAVPGAFEDGV